MKTVANARKRRGKHFENEEGNVPFVLFRAIFSGAMTQAGLI